MMVMNDDGDDDDHDMRMMIMMTMQMGIENATAASFKMLGDPSHNFLTIGLIINACYVLCL